jgi:molybdopterin-guanine dinucleotide biosynthesis protein A
MSRDKAWIEIEGAPMIRRVAVAARPAVRRLAIVLNAANPHLDRYRELAATFDATLVFDLHDHRGPLGGIHTALTHCGVDDSALILACDLPFLTTQFLSFLTDIHQQPHLQASSQTVGRNPRSITVPLDPSNRPQPLAAIYDQSLLATIGRMIQANELKVDLLFSLAPTRRIDFTELAHLPGAERFFTNVNTLEDWRNILLLKNT